MELYIEKRFSQEHAIIMPHKLQKIHKASIWFNSNRLNPTTLITPFKLSGLLPLVFWLSDIIRRIHYNFCKVCTTKLKKSAADYPNQFTFNCDPNTTWRKGCKVLKAQLRLSNYIPLENLLGDFIYLISMGYGPKSRLFVSLFQMLFPFWLPKSKPVVFLSVSARIQRILPGLARVNGSFS